ncbi:MAG: 16S rRNA (cytosine(1402)-N(4))-methyltransferase RsmH [Candidatus Marinimicrobia bacterium]|jgi:16S rRNA (cytosine1402-N4)-methyltransferase|nr:16S rRNA (cytosine(1402)-N(4))-methyltransferase RsmH [Candidatus Neomarinimicrobiota bacterium]MBT3676086.1 16S rRNA (cytosine(1402)-N(4))-methyltransferase RsmH [Candidatus Neomarinimicrobiota bacterium]MBT3764014.1 16S rRNA (cytosine(1402)-N(4))-methyltransferase RsmH [Candidatus Neomarinimicrobiota bacterium]MBT4067765.1 16S rRNA (cytosine(1402)-N(4))-methyltransferase RsmH [Candidatus Neomarinimicrobiota bacterium]MBT4270779.1 16S rRNA (cytosine(1402)-N(4))-methyltransferase RsmH [Candi
MIAQVSQEHSLPHIPVMVSEVMEYLNLQPKGIYLDGTVGAGGHATQILNRLSSQGQLIGIDRDAEALQICENLFGASARPISVHQSSYHKFPDILNRLGISKVNGILLDLGLSSMQLDSDSRGFAFESEGQLDMRFNGNSGETAAELISRSSDNELANIIYQFGEERHSRRIARSIKNFSNLSTVADLKEAVRRSTPPQQRRKSLARVFQAIRIAVNGELEKLASFLDIFFDHLAVGGRVVIMSYHSLEDRMVKHAFRSLKQAGELKVLTKKPITPSEDEQAENSRSRSAKLRAAERIV